MADDATQSQGARIRARREQAGLTQLQLCDAVGTSISYLSRLENDVSSPTVTMLCRLAKAMGIDPRDLLICPDSVAS